jgi:hypothetical protein
MGIGWTANQSRFTRGSTVAEVGVGFVVWSHELTEGEVLTAIIRVTARAEDGGDTLHSVGFAMFAASRSVDGGADLSLVGIPSAAGTIPDGDIEVTAVDNAIVVKMGYTFDSTIDWVVRADVDHV